MGLIDNTSKAIRLLISRRYTSGDLTTAQEAFTSTLDIKSSEVYTQDHLVPVSSLPFSGSTQNRQNYSTEGSDIMKYWYRLKMTKSNVDNDVWFFLSTPASDSGITPQLINSNQTANFISPQWFHPISAINLTSFIISVIFLYLKIINYSIINYI